ncbi:FRG domain-containing protein [Enterobacter pseudoroggenkampii]|uniref:FRG domain-containing protein n=1 Tax=Enterobacter pseudoroggenkampii TaxID=2996112 RepID=UPI0038A2A107
MSTSKGPVTEQTYDDWIQFTNHLSYFADDMGFIFRGHHNSDWKLETSLDRTLLRIKPAGIDLGSTYNFVLDMFAKNLRGRTSINKNIETNADELWSLGQHYGLATPLLDWSRSIFVALFFAFESHLPSPSGFRSIWAFHTGS